MRVVLLGLSQLEIDRQAEFIRKEIQRIDQAADIDLPDESLLVQVTGLIVNSLMGLAVDDQNRVLLKLVEGSGGKAAMVEVTNRARKALAEGRSFFKPMTTSQKIKFAVWSVLATASVAASAYHGAKRHRGSVGWGLVWGAAGAVFPVITPAVAIAQGYGKVQR